MFGGEIQHRLQGECSLGLVKKWCIISTLKYDFIFTNGQYEIIGKARQEKNDISKLGDNKNIIIGTKKETYFDVGQTLP